MRLFISLIGIFFLFGCSTISPQISKFDAENYEANKKMAQETMKTWSFNSGFITCAGLTDRVKFPIMNAQEARALLNNSSIILGIAELDEIARRLNYWKNEDYDLGCSLGIKARIAALSTIDILKLFPTLTPYIGMLFP